jgi:hypothetical protein
MRQGVLAALASWNTENLFRAMAATGDVTKALAVLDRLDAADASVQMPLKHAS